jgi:hypothetical protein
MMMMMMMRNDVCLSFLLWSEVSMSSARPTGTKKSTADIYPTPISNIHKIKPTKCPPNPLSKSFKRSYDQGINSKMPFKYGKIAIEEAWQLPERISLKEWNWQ